MPLKGNLSPFRYPGAKNRLLAELESHLSWLLERSNGGFCDAFVGGGSVLLAVALAFPYIKLFANDKDPSVYSFWQVISGESQQDFDTLLLALEQPVTIEHYTAQRKRQLEANPSRVELAYWALFFNRTSFSGILKASPIGGKDQTSAYKVNCRYNAPNLIEKVKTLRELLKGRVQVTNLDINQYDVLRDEGIVAYLDPPYYVKGGMLYTEWMQPQEHERLAESLKNRSNWVLSYDDCPEIRTLYRDSNVIELNARYSINGKKPMDGKQKGEGWIKKTELLIVPENLPVSKSLLEEAFPEEDSSV